jgi:steroid delta-isomerase-like uncharacterized protein
VNGVDNAAPWVDRCRDPAKEEQMDHVATMRRAYELINAGDVDGFGALLSDDFVEHETTPGIAPTKEGTLEFFRIYRAAFPDLHFEPEDYIASGDNVVVRVTVSGTNTGDFMGMPATGKRMEIDVIDIVRFEDDGLGHEHWGVADVMGMMQQLGVVPMPAGAAV